MEEEALTAKQVPVPFDRVAETVIIRIILYFIMKHSTPVPTDAELSFQHAPPLKLLHPDVPADKMYHLVMKEKLWASWSGDTFGVCYFGDQKPFEADVKGKVMTIRDKMILRNQNGEELAILLKMHFKWETTFKIYGYTPYVEGQAPSENQTYDDKPLYEWAKCKDKFFSIRKTMTMADGVEYVTDGVGPMMDLRQIRITRNGLPCVHMKEINMGIFTGNQWEIIIGPGIDPCLIVAFAAIMDEMNENG